MISTKITIDKTKLAQSKQQLTALANSVQAYKLNASLSADEGDVAEAMLQLGDSLQSFAAAFAELANQCAAALGSTAEKVEHMDAETSALFELKG